MKNLLILFTILLTASTGLVAQSVSQGMRFQALARDLQGHLLANEKLEVKVELYAAQPEEKVHYTEAHHLQSNDLGLLDFVIGEGANFGGDFNKIPWADQKMWVRISVKTLQDDDYQLITSGQLYSVPYALYANTAGTLTNDGSSTDTTAGRGQTLDQTSIYWTLDGNYNAHAVKPNGPAVLGTKDRKDLTMITNNIPRLIIDKDGDISFLFDVNFEGDLNVNGNTTLNGSLSLISQLPTKLSGTLGVDKATSLRDELNVIGMSPTYLSGSLTVDQPVSILGSTTIENNLDVENAATQLSGTLETDKETSLNALTVTGMSSTHLTGTLDVDRTLNVDGATTLNNPVRVTGENATHLTGVFTVWKATILNAALTVANAAPTYLTGTLKVDGASSIGGDFTLDGHLEVANMHPTTMTGTLDVDKLATMNAGLQVNGSGRVGPGNEHLAYFNNTEGGSGDGIAIQLANEQIDKNNNFMTFYRGTNTVAGRIEGYDFGDIADIPVPTSDEIWSAVCVGIADYNPLTIVWTQTATAFNLFSGLWNSTTIPSFDIPDIPAFAIPDVPALTIPNVPAFAIPDVPGFNIPDIPGVVIPDIPGLTIGPLLCTNICFCPCSIDITDWNCCCEDVCLIPGSFTVWPAITIPDFPGIAIPDFPGIVVPDFPGIVVPDFPGIVIPDFPGLVIPAVPEINLAEVFGECPTIPTFSDILISEGICPDEDIFDLNDGYVRRLAEWAFEHRLQSVVSADPLKLLGNAIAWGLTTSVMHNGVVYGSKGADYAEYLPKMYTSEQFMKGEVVGVFNGKISKNTLHADQILAITSQPLVLGNMQDEDIIADFETVAFLGQIPVFVYGPVQAGDYIVASGKNDGIARAVKADDITAEMLSIVLGTAWETHAGDDVALVNTSIGLRPMEIAEVVKNQDVLENLLQEKVETHRSESAQLANDLALIKKTVYNP